MPTYEYKREDGSTFEISQSINDEKLKTCPETGQTVTRIISGGGGVVYKGTGWYVTDYSGKKPNASCSSQDENTSDTKKESTATKTETQSSSSDV